MQAREGAAVGSEKMRLAPDRENGAVQAAAPHPRPARAPASALSPEGAGERGTVLARCRSASVILPKVSSGDQRARSPATRSRVSRILRSPGKAGWERGAHLAAIRLLYEYAHERPRACGASRAPAASAERRPSPCFPGRSAAARRAGAASAAGSAPLPTAHFLLPTAYWPLATGYSPPSTPPTYPRPPPPCHTRPRSASSRACFEGVLVRRRNRTVRESLRSRAAHSGRAPRPL